MNGGEEGEDGEKKGRVWSRNAATTQNVRLKILPASPPVGNSALQMYESELESCCIDHSMIKLSRRSYDALIVNRRDRGN